MDERFCEDCGRRFRPKTWNQRFCLVHRRTKPTDGRYGWAHQKARGAWEDRVAAGTVLCARCGKPIHIGEPWDLGHDDIDRTRYTGPEHVRCNRATSSHRQKMRRQRSRYW